MGVKHRLGKSFTTVIAGDCAVGMGAIVAAFLDLIGGWFLSTKLAALIKTTCAKIRGQFFGNCG